MKENENENRKPVEPTSVIEDLYGNDLHFLMDELKRKIDLKDYEHSEKLAFIKVNVSDIGYNQVVLNEVKRRYLGIGWGNVFYSSNDGKIFFQLYFPQTQIKGI